jgi:hypothetical protein
MPQPGCHALNLSGETMKLRTFLLIGFLLLFAACTSKQATVKLTVYFTNINRYAIGTEPYEDSVTRTVPLTGALPEMVLTQVFLGPTAQEKAQGLETILSGTTGFSNFTIRDGVARLYLTGKCNSAGATYTISNLIFANLAQFPEIHWIKIYDENGGTETPDGQTSSIPFCLEP